MGALHLPSALEKLAQLAPQRLGELALAHKVIELVHGSLEEHLPATRPRRRRRTLARTRAPRQGTACRVWPSVLCMWVGGVGGAGKRG